MSTITSELRADLHAHEERGKKLEADLKERGLDHNSKDWTRYNVDMHQRINRYVDSVQDRKAKGEEKMDDDVVRETKDIYNWVTGKKRVY